MKSIITICLFLFFFISNTIAQASFVEVFDEPKGVLINATLNKADCNNKAYVPLDLPENTKGVIYAVTAVNKSAYEAPEKKLLEEVIAVRSKNDPSKISDYLVPEGTQRTFNFYIIKGKENIKSFYDCGSYKYQEKFIDTKSLTGYINIENSNGEALYLGIENNQDLKNLRLIIEAVAVVYD